MTLNQCLLVNPVRSSNYVLVSQFSVLRNSASSPRGTDRTADSCCFNFSERIAFLDERTGEHTEKDISCQHMRFNRVFMGSTLKKPPQFFAFLVPATHFLGGKKTLGYLEGVLSTFGAILYGSGHMAKTPSFFFGRFHGWKINCISWLGCIFIYTLVFTLSVLSKITIDIQISALLVVLFIFIGLKIYSWIGICFSQNYSLLLFFRTLFCDWIIRCFLCLL